jgi:hypothetical protein
VRQLYPEYPVSLYKAYLESTETSYFILDFAQDTDRHVRFRTGVFPDEKTIIYASVDNETHNVEFSWTPSIRKGQREIKKNNSR